MRGEVDVGDPVDIPDKAEVIFEVVNLSAGYGKVQVLRGTSLELAEGEVLAILGSNGVGKSTLLRCVSGLLGRPWEGYIRFCGQDIGGSPPHKISRLGIPHIPEGRGIFPGLTVEENLQLGMSGKRKGDEIHEFAVVCDMFPILAKKMREKAGHLSGGQQQMVAIARALVSEPRLILLDEPSLGLAPKVVDEVYERLIAVKESGVALILVEQSVSHVMQVADKVSLLELGGRLRPVSVGETGVHTDNLLADYWGI